MKTTFSNVDYVMEHGKQPKGVGDWAFSKNRHPNPDEIFWCHGSLTEAKKQAAEHFKGAFLVYVLA